MTQSVTVVDESGRATPASVLHSIGASAPASSFTVATDLSPPTVTAAGPLLTGTLSFSGFGAGDIAAAELTSHHTATVDSIGATTPAASGRQGGPKRS